MYVLGSDVRAKRGGQVLVSFRDGEQRLLGSLRRDRLGLAVEKLLIAFLSPLLRPSGLVRSYLSLRCGWRSRVSNSVAHYALGTATTYEMTGARART